MPDDKLFRHGEIRNDGGQAFPSTSTSGSNGEYYNDATPGMTLRDWFAGQCPITMSEAWMMWTAKPMTLGAIVKEREGFYLWWTTIRYEYADAMLKERAK